MPEDLALRYGDRPLSASLPLPSSKGGYSSSVREPLVERPARLSQTMTSVAESPLRRSYAEDPRARRSEDRMFVSEGPDGRRIVTREGSDGQRYAVSATESDRVLGGLSPLLPVTSAAAIAQSILILLLQALMCHLVYKYTPDADRMICGFAATQFFFEASATSALAWR